MVHRQLAAIHIVHTDGIISAFDLRIAGVVNKHKPKEIPVKRVRVEWRDIPDYKNPMDLLGPKHAVEFEELGAFVLDNTDRTIKAARKQFILDAENNAAKKRILLGIFRLEKSHVVTSRGIAIAMVRDRGLKSHFFKTASRVDADTFGSFLSTRLMVILLTPHFLAMRAKFGLFS